MQKLFFEADFLSKQPALCIFNKRKYHTLFGMIFSFLVCGTLIGFAAYFLDRFFRRSDLNLIYTQDASGIDNSINMSEVLFFISFGNAFINDTVLKLSVSYFKSFNGTTDYETF